MDDIDRANDQAEQMLDFQRRARKPVLKSIGRCYYCDDDLRMGIFCCSECRDDYEKQERQRAIRGSGNDE